MQILIWQRHYVRSGAGGLKFKDGNNPCSVVQRAGAFHRTVDEVNTIYGK